MTGEGLYGLPWGKQIQIDGSVLDAALERTPKWSTLQAEGHLRRPSLEAALQREHWRK